MKYNRFSRLDIPKMLDRLGIKARERMSGRKFAASCPHPDHVDKSPSWYIKNIPGEPLHGAHACQGCKWKGGPISLASVVLGISEEEAKKWLLDLTAPPPMPSRIEVEFKEDKRYVDFKTPSCFRFDPIGAWPKVHRDYLLKRVTERQVERWGIGYIAQCGCRNKRHSNRIAIVVRDKSGLSKSYTSRSVIGSKLKYVEPESEENARRVIFGEQFWDNQEVLVVVEGIFDALAVEQVLGEDVAVAALRGSSPHPLALARISRFPKVIVMTDNDKAGKKARLDIHASCGRHTKIVDVELEPKIDASTMIETTEGKIQLEKILREAL